uniref:Carboxylic ester hydrolase n=1 Tax=Phlebotomus papatasi TaxID=29031 RepID=A0A1B0GPW9_PHLPP
MSNITGITGFRYDCIPSFSFIPCNRGGFKNILKQIPANIFATEGFNYNTTISWFGELFPCFVPTSEENDATWGRAIVRDEQPRLIAQPLLSDVPLIIGHMVAEQWEYYNVSIDTLTEKWNYSYPNTRTHIISPIRQYLISGTKELANPSKQILVHAAITHGVKQFADYHSIKATSKTYFYRFSHKNSSNDIGSFHGDGLQYIFVQNNPNNLWTYEDYNVRDRIIRYITNFAKFGDPTPILDSLITTPWHPYYDNGLRMEISHDSKMLTAVTLQLLVKMKNKHCAFFYFLIGNICILVAGQCQVTLKQKFGQVQGNGLTSVTQSGNLYCSFLGIPYALPPIGKLRFEPPQPMDLSTTSNFWYFTRQSPICIQNPIFTDLTNGQEDCLYLNVYTKSTKPEKLKPVIVVIIGTWFHSGSPYDNGVNRPDYLVDEDVVVVTFNYRLGILGFLYREDAGIAGNNGLRDQQEVFKWVQKNIVAFGGDPKRVTLMGWSAGSASISYHLQAPSSCGLFHGAIMSSGTNLNPWAYQRNTKQCIRALCKT